MIPFSIRVACFYGVSSLMTASAVVAQTLDTPMTRLRPIGSPSAVDQYRSTGNPQRLRETGYQPGAVERQNAWQQPSAVQQTVLLQQIDAPPLPGGTMQLPGNFNQPQAPNVNSVPGPPFGSTSSPATAPRSLPVNPGSLQAVPMNQSMPMSQNGQIPSSSDVAPIARPQLNDGFATIDNCNCISPPSSYIAASGCGGCAPVSYQAPQGYVAPPAQIAAPAILPSGAAVAPGGGGVPSALISFGQETYPVQVGQGLFGQPVAYVPGQRIRNWIRYIFP